ncbi:MAG TPA: dipeptidase [Thermohalobaculum sp.]|nr:dipeptidase [Thermohalobaculum sp.]
MSALESVLARLDADRDAALGRLSALVACRSISTDPAYAGECARAADWLVEDLESIGFEARAVPTEGHPIVLAKNHESDGPHVLFYGPYDVQPVDPLELWEGDPFEMQVRSRDDGTEYLFGRGTSDDKGQLMTFIEACRAWKAETGRLPCRVTVVLEGEEESGGENLPPFLESHAAELAADVALVCDTGMWDRDTPAITTMLRGLLGEEVTITAADRDLHSGFYGGAAANPITVLARVLGQLHDGQGRVQIPGFYDGVPDLSPEVRQQWHGLGFEVQRFLGEIGLAEPVGEQGYSALEHTWSRPTAEVNGIQGGYTGAGFKTVIPSKASAKVSFRLVGEQDPHAIRESFRAFVQERVPADCKVEFAGHGASSAITMPLDDPAFERARKALSDEWGHEASFIGCGGSIPVVGQFKRRLGIDSLLIGFGLEDDRIHSPNEKYELKSFTRGARSWARVLQALANGG